MGRRYRNQMLNKKDIITYHVYQGDRLLKSFPGDKMGAESYQKSLKIETEVRKTRHIVDI